MWENVAKLACNNLLIAKFGMEEEARSSVWFGFIET